MLRLALTSLFVLFPLLASAQPDGCRGRVVHGDPAHPNVLETVRDGQTTRLHFPEVVAREGSGSALTLYLPAVTHRTGSPAWLGGRPDARPEGGAFSLVLDLDPEGTFSSDRLTARLIMLPRVPCLAGQDEPGERLLGRGADAVTVTEDGDALVVEAVSEHDGTTTRLAVRTTQRIAFADVPLPEGAQPIEVLRDAERGVVHVLSGPNTRTIPLPTGDRVAVESRHGLEVDVFTTLDAERAVIARHVLPLSDDQTAILRLPFAHDLDALELDETTRRSVRVGPVAEVRLPVVPLAPAEGEAPIPSLAWSDFLSTEAPPAARAAVAHRLIGTQGEGASQLVLADTLIGGAPHFVWRVEPLDLGAASLDALPRAELDALGSIVATIRALHQGEIETLEAATEAFRPTLESLGRWMEVEALAAEMAPNPLAEALPLVEAAVAPDAPEADVEAALAVLHELGMAPDPYDLGPPDSDASDPARDEHERLIRWMRAVPLSEMRYQANHGTPPLFEAIQTVIVRHFGPLTIDAYAMRLAADDPSIEGVPMQRPPASRGPRITLDPAVLRPVARRAVVRVPGPGLDLTYTMDYTAGRLAVRNEHQGEDAQPLPLPEGTLDALALFNVLPFLDLTSPQTLPLVDFAASQSAGYSSGEGAYQRAHLAPEPTRVSLEPHGPAEDGPEGVAALRVRLFFEGSPSPLFGLNPRMLPTDDRGRPFVELLVRAEAPHYPLALTVGRDALRFWGLAEGEPLPPEALVWLNELVDPRGGP